MIKDIYKNKTMFIPKLKKEINTNELTEQDEAMLKYLGYGFLFEVLVVEVETPIEEKKYRKRKYDTPETDY